MIQRASRRFQLSRAIQFKSSRNSRIYWIDQVLKESVPARRESAACSHDCRNSSGAALASYMSSSPPLEELPSSSSSSGVLLARVRRQHQSDTFFILLVGRRGAKEYFKFSSECSECFFRLYSIWDSKRCKGIKSFPFSHIHTLSMSLFLHALFNADRRSFQRVSRQIVHSNEYLVANFGFDAAVYRSFAPRKSPLKFANR